MPLPIEEALQSEIGHDGGDDAAAAQPPSRAQASPISASTWSPSISAPRSSASKHAVGIAIQRHAEIGAVGQHLAA